MANEIVYSGIGDLVTAEVLSAQYLRLLAARGSLIQHPALIYAGDAAGRGSATIKVPHIGLDGYDALASTNDGTAVSNTALTDGSTTVTVARYSKKYTRTDLARLAEPNGLLSPEMFARDAVISGNVKLLALIAALGSGFSSSVGTSGSNASVQNFLDAKRQLNNNNVEGELLAMLHPQQWSDIMDELLLSSGGAIQFQPATLEMAAMLGNGYQGKLAGVDVFTSTLVPTANAGADRAGFMFGRGAVIWADATIAVDNPAEQVVLGNKVLFERDRDADAGQTEYITHQYLGVAEGIDLAGVGIITDA